jgi:hypothetical protein
MELSTILALFGFILIILLIEYIYWFRYIPNMKRLAKNNYEDL